MNPLAMPDAPTRRNAPRLLAALLACCLAAGCNAPASDAAGGEPPLAGAAIGGPFTLTDAQGQTVRWDDFAGKYRIVYFGYTYCPDVCPTDMQRLAQGYRRFKEEEPQRAGELVPMFISVDPERDTPEKVGEFTRAFSPDFIGLTGTPEQVAEAAKSFSVYYEKGDPSSGGGYLVNHSSAAYLMGPDGKPIALLPIDVADKGEAVAAELEQWVS